MTAKNRVQPLDDRNTRGKDNTSHNSSVFVIGDRAMTSYPEELNITNFRSQEIVPHLDNYRMSIDEGKTKQVKMISKQ